MGKAWHGSALTMRTVALVLSGSVVAALSGCTSNDTSIKLTIATVNNDDMVIMRDLAAEFERQNPRVHIKWVVLEANILRQRVTTDVATGTGQFDVVTIGNYEVPIWAKQGWLTPVSGLRADYDVDDLLQTVRASVSDQGRLFALPFYAESAMTFYRRDLFADAGLKMPDHPTYRQIAEFAVKLNDPAHQQYGICLRGKPGWGENMATVTSLVHAFGGRWFDEHWHPTIDSPEWHRAIEYYTTLLKSAGPPGITSNGFNENLVLFAAGHCAMWIDATVAASLLYNAKQTQIAGRVGYSAMPTGDDADAPTWLWSWDLAVPASSKHQDAAMKFITWATSKDYIGSVARAKGWIAVPPGTRYSTYNSPAYQKAAPFSAFIQSAIENASPSAQKDRQHNEGAQFVAIPEFQSIGTQVGQIMAATLSGEMTVDAALLASQAVTERTMRQAGYATER
jgi:sorbitol/mannitol transport system substrate-binding protein